MVAVPIKGNRLADFASSSLTAGLVVMAGALVLMLPALANGFPFMFPDSGDYLVFTPQLHRSPYYGLFIAFFHVNHFIWGPVVAQCLIVSHLLWLALQTFGSGRLIRDFAVCVAALTAFSSLPFFTGFIMADIFTALMFLLLYLIAFHIETYTRPLQAYLLLLTCVSMAAHISNLTMAVALLPLLLGLLLWSGRSPAAAARRVALLLVPIALTAAATLLNNVVIHRSVSLSPAGQSFLMANLIHYGPARSHIREACPEAGYKICAYADRLPETANDLLWNTGIYAELGNFKGMEEEARAIVRATLAERPREVAGMVASNLLAALATREPGREFRPEEHIPEVSDLLLKKFGPDANAAYLASLQMRGELPHGLLRAIDAVAVPAALVALILLAVAAARDGRRESAALAVIVICSVAGNTLLCAAVSGVHDRYQARVTWLLLFAALLLFFQYMDRTKTATSRISA